MPDGASLQRTEDVRKQLSTAARKIPGVSDTVEIAGLSALDSTNRTNTLTMFLTLKSFEDRNGHPEQNSLAILQKVQAATAAIQDAFILVIPPPPVQGIGNSGGFKLQVEDRRSAGVEALAATTSNLMAAGMKAGGLTGFFTSFRTQVPQIYLNIDRDKAEALNVPIESVFQTLASLPRVDLRQRLQLPGPHLPGQPPGRRAVSRAARPDP